MKHGRVVLVAVGTETRGNVSDGPVSRSPSHTHQVHAHSRYKPLSALFSPDAPTHSSWLYCFPLHILLCLDFCVDQ